MVSDYLLFKSSDSFYDSNMENGTCILKLSLKCNTILSQDVVLGDIISNTSWFQHFCTAKYQYFIETEYAVTIITEDDTFVSVFCSYFHAKLSNANVLVFKFLLFNHPVTKCSSLLNVNPMVNIVRYAWIRKPALVFIGGLLRYQLCFNSRKSEFSISLRASYPS